MATTAVTTEVLRKCKTVENMGSAPARIATLNASGWILLCTSSEISSVLGSLLATSTSTCSPSTAMSGKRSKTLLVSAAVAALIAANASLGLRASKPFLLRSRARATRAPSTAGAASSSAIAFRNCR